MVKMLKSCNKMKGNTHIFPRNIKYLKRIIIIIKKHWTLQRAQIGIKYQVNKKSKKNKCNPNLRNKQAIYETNQASTKGSKCIQVSRKQKQI